MWHDSIKVTLTTQNGGKVDDPAWTLKPSPANGLQHLSCFSIDSFQNYFCHSELHISSQMSFLDFIMPLCNRSFRSATPQAACPWGFPYLGIQVTWACWYWKNPKKAPHHSLARNPTVKTSDWKPRRFHIYGRKQTCAALQYHWTFKYTVGNLGFFSLH